MPRVLVQFFLGMRLPRQSCKVHCISHEKEGKESKFAARLKTGIGFTFFQRVIMKCFADAEDGNPSIQTTGNEPFIAREDIEQRIQKWLQESIDPVHDLCDLEGNAITSDMTTICNIDKKIRDSPADQIIHGTKRKRANNAKKCVHE